jgi:periplasmic protein TonB
MTTGKQNKLSGICASLGLHGLAAIILIFSLSGNAMIPHNPGKLDFVWVSLAAKDQASFSNAGKNRRPEISSTINRISAMPETAAIKNVPREPATTGQISARVASDATPASFASRTVAYAPTDGHSPVSHAGIKNETSEVTPASSVAYPLYRENPPPGYPAMARQNGYEGVVFVQAEILTDGRVGRTVISKSSGYAILDQTAVSAVKTWKFEPAKKSGVPYKTWAELPIKFMISDRHSQS